MYETELEKAQRELEQLRIEKDRAEQQAIDDFKRELKYRLARNTTRYLIPKPKTTIAKRNMKIKEQRLQNYVFTQRQTEIAERIVANMKGNK